MSNELSPESWSAGLIYMAKNSSNSNCPSIWPRKQRSPKFFPDLETINEDCEEDTSFYDDLPDISPEDYHNYLNKSID